LYAVWEAQ